jgi:glutathione S-transferase
MIQLFQAEWCPYSAAVRQRLTELGVDYVIRQVAPEPPDRDALREATGDDIIPALILGDGSVLSGETREILAALDEHFAPHEWEDGHRLQARLHDR